MKFFRALFFAACFACAGCHRKNDPVAEANRFFSLVQQGKNNEAYQNAAFGFQAQQSQASFEANVHDLGLENFSSLTWKRVVTRGDEVKLDGELTLRDGGKFDFEATMSRDRGRWRLFALRTSGGEALPTKNPFTLVGRGMAFQDVANRPVPPEAEVRALVRGTIQQFNDAIQQKNFEEFYQHVAVSWQKQVSPKRLRNAFDSFIENKINLEALGVGKVEPAFTTPPVVNGEGLLVVNGFFPTQPYRVAFSFKYMYEVPRWKLFGIDVNLLSGG